MDKPFLHLFILTRIKRNTKCNIIDKGFLYNQIARVILRNGGIPKFMIKYVIEDMVELGLIECINNRDLYKLNEIKEEKKINALYVID